MAKKLMIVDERAMTRHLVRLAAATPHDTVLECATADDAAAAVGAFKPDCVMMGVSLPAPGAFKAIKNIRKTFPEVRVVAVSAVDEPASRHAALDAGASAFVSTENLSELFLLAAPERISAKLPRRKKSNGAKK